MGNIVLLDDLTINKIAAGEVIERPASVIKEMVENSIDAGANNICVEIRNGGISYIRITDNGKGIAPDDMELAFERHATSKIRQASDLDLVKTMGFRGEALASIAAISKVEMMSKMPENEIGNKIVVEGGNVLESGEIGCANGTTITVQNLFFNTPVRYKFLKKDYTEAGYIEDTITRLALVNPNIAFKLINSGKTIIQTSGNGDIKSVIYSIYGKDIASSVLEVNYNYENIHIEGMIGKPEIARSNRGNQLFFVNKRYIKDKTLAQAAEQAFKGLLPIGKFGFLVLNLDMDLSTVDINVHPAKLEVRFQEENKVFKAVYHAIKDTLLKSELVENTSKEKDEEPINNVNFFTPRAENKTTFSSLFKKISKTPQEDTFNENNMIEKIYNQNKENENKQNEQNTAEQNTTEKNNVDIKTLGVFQELAKIQQELKQTAVSNGLTSNIEDIIQKTKELENNLSISKSENIQNAEPQEESKQFENIISSEEKINELDNVNDVIQEENKIEEENEEYKIENKVEEENEEYKIEKMPEPQEKGDTIIINGEEIKEKISEEQENIEKQDIKQNNDEEQTISPADILNYMANEKVEMNEEKFNSMYEEIFGTSLRKKQQEEKKDETIFEAFDVIDDNNISVFENDEQNKLNYKFIGIAFSTYIILEIDNEMYILDQHAAHERILYEKVKKNYYSDEEKDSQMLLLPDIITLTHKEMDIARDNMEVFRKAGFDIEEFGENTIKLSGAPNICINLDTKELFLETLDEINTVARTAKQEIEERFIATVACKAAVKANMALTKEEVDSLMEELLKLPNPFTCPHGRPTAIKMTKTDIEKKFARRK